jgi:hypothetical protein
MSPLATGGSEPSEGGSLSSRAELGLGLGTV